MKKPAAPTIDLGGDVTMPRLGLGTWPMTGDTAEMAVTQALSRGYRLIDTAAAYGNEDGVGRALMASGIARSELFVTTKLARTAHGHDTALRAFDQSLRALALDYVDLYLIHWPMPALELYVSSWRALIRLQAEGKVRAIGVSNFKPAHIDRLIEETGVVPAVNQIECHPRFQQVELRAFHEQNGIVTTSWSPLGRGGLIDDDAIGAIARKHGKSPAQVMLRWHVENGLCVIPKSSSRDRQAENLDIFGFALDADDLAAIGWLDSADGRIGPNPDTF
jgi:2,5-diketo-D-gluconate reductase A